MTAPHFPFLPGLDLSQALYRQTALLECLQGYSLLRADQSGWIEVTTDGEGMWVQVAR